jgi:hypothetical protein
MNERYIPRENSNLVDFQSLDLAIRLLGQCNYGHVYCQCCFDMSLPQVGATPEGVEIPLAATDTALQALIAQQPAHHRASPFAHPDPSDPKWRFMWRIGPRPTTTAFAELNADPVVPAG